MSSPKMIVLRSSDDETFDVEEAVALESQTIKHMIEDDCANTSIPLPNVTSKILARVIEYCKKHVEAPKSDDSNKAAEDELQNFDADFVKVDQGTLFDLILGIPKLENLSQLGIQPMSMLLAQLKYRKCSFPLASLVIRHKALLSATMDDIMDCLSGI